jgi:hypothetical protein
VFLFVKSCSMKGGCIQGLGEHVLTGAFTSAMGGGKLGSARSSSAVRHVHIVARRDVLLARQLSYRKLTNRGGGMTTFSAESPRFHNYNFELFLPISVSIGAFLTVVISCCDEGGWQAVV